MSIVFVHPHESGVGVYVRTPVGVPYRVWRDPGPVEYDIPLNADGEVERDPMTGEIIGIEPTGEAIPILQGVETRNLPYLDWDVPPGNVTYWLEVQNTDTKVWTEVARQTVTLEADMAYSVFEDGATMDCLNVRDAIAVFFSIRLAQLAREGAVVAIKPEWKQKFPMTVAYDFGEADLPLGAVGFSYGKGQQFDLGWSATEEDLKFSLQFVAKTRDERDSITSAVRGLLMELDWFLGDMGCVNTCYGEMAEGYQQVEPILYHVELAIGTTCLVFHKQKDVLWRILPITWFSPNGNLGVIVNEIPKR